MVSSNHITVTGPEHTRRPLSAALRRRTGRRFGVDEYPASSLPSVLAGDETFEALIACGESMHEGLAAELETMVEDRPWVYLIAPARGPHVFDTYTPGHEAEMLLSLAKAYRHFVFTRRLKRLEAEVQLPQQQKMEIGRGAPVVAVSEQMRRILAYLNALSGFGLPLLLIGEPGSGREELARMAQAMQCPEAPFTALRVSGMTPQQLAHALSRAGGGREAGTSTGDGTCRWSTVHLRGLADLDEEALALVEESFFSRAALPRLAQGKAAGGGELVCTAGVDVERLAELGPDSPVGRFVHRYEDLAVHVPPLRERPEDLPVLSERIAKGVCRELGFPEELAGEAVKRLSPNDVYAGNLYALFARLLQNVSALRRNGRLW